MTYRHPSTPDPWAEVQEIPPYTPPESDPSGFIVLYLVIGSPVVALVFTLGYMSGVWGWI